MVKLTRSLVIVQFVLSEPILIFCAEQTILISEKSSEVFSFTISVVAISNFMFPPRHPFWIGAQRVARGRIGAAWGTTWHLLAANSGGTIVAGCPIHFTVSS
jgi:hypothetical protein